MSTKSAEFELTFQRCIMKNSCKISLVLVLPAPWFVLSNRKCQNFACHRLVLENTFSNVN